MNQYKAEFKDSQGIKTTLYLDADNIKEAETEARKIGDRSELNLFAIVEVAASGSLF